MMTPQTGLEASTLGDLLSLQSSLQAASDDERLLAMVTRGLARIPAVQACAACVDGTVWWSDGRPAQRCVTLNELERPTPGACKLCLFSRPEGWRAIGLRTLTAEYGVVFVRAAMPAAFAPYLPFVSNTVDLAALRLEHNRTAAELAALNRGLEEQVRERTRQLRESEALLATSQEIAHVGSWELDPIRNRLTWSDEVYRMFGLPMREFGASYEAFLACVHPDDRGEVDDAYGRSLREGRDSYDIEHRIVRRDTGEIRIVHEKCVHVRDAAGVVVRSVGMVQDITARRRAEEQRIVLERQMQHAQKLESLGVLAGGIAHDFNNLLMAILGHADLALDLLPAGTPVRAHLGEIKSSAGRAAEFARQMLAYSGRGRFLIEQIDAERLVRDMTDLLQATVGKRVALTFDFADDLPAFSGDATQVRQVIVNLITNASEAIGDQPGAIRVSAGRTFCSRDQLDRDSRLLGRPSDEPLPEGVYVFIEVRDTGCGMDGETLERVFDPFFSTKFTGRGLGMSAVLGIVRGHKGTIHIQSAPGEGSTFTVLFPVVREAAPVAAINPGDTAGRNEWRGTGVVLLADDEESVRSIGGRMLERLGFRVVLAQDGREALREYERHAGDIVAVLLDLAMPHMDGEEAVAALRAIDPQVPVALCSGYLGDEAVARARQTGPAVFIQKPYNVGTLRRALRELLEGRGFGGAEAE
jgi:two-component system, cell cycle sensor histidine kinase and response regulator CckA